MPGRNSLKKFREDAIYHVYNRGVGKQPIFQDLQDYRAFMRRLELALLPVDSAEKLQRTKDRIRIANFYGQLELLAYCLMPNHYHLMFWQRDVSDISQLMRTLGTSYSMYFNLKYDRVGPLFQGRFKAAAVDSDSYALHLSRYIHCNPLPLDTDIYTYPFSSLQYYFSPQSPLWLRSKFIEDQFSGIKEYRSFVNELRHLEATDSQYGLD